jgi:hypothetical protein
MASVSNRGGMDALQRRRLANPVVRLLLDSLDDAVRGTVPFSSYGGLDTDVVSAAVGVHKVAPAVYLHLRHDEGVPAELSASLRRAYQQQVVRQLQVQADLRQLAGTLDDAGVSWLAMKGPVLAERLWSRPDLRQYVDLDLLVDPPQFGQALDAIVAAGADMVDRNWELIDQQRRAEVSLRLPNGTVLDLHWNVVNNPALRRQFSFSTGEMLGRSIPVTIGGTAIRTLDPVDTLLHVAYHTAHSGGHRLMWLKDVERATADPDLEWPETFRRARAYGVELILAVVLARIERVMGFGVRPPDAAFDAARRSPWGLLTTGIDLWFPAPTLPKDRFSAQIAFKNARRSSLASVVAAVTSLKDRGASSTDAADNPLYIERGGQAARASYLRAVQGGVDR